MERYVVMARSATRGAFVSENAGLVQHVRGWHKYAAFELRLWTDAFVFWCRRHFFRLLILLRMMPDFEKQLKGSMNFH